MKSLFTVLIVLVSVGAVLGADDERQGGDTFATAQVIASLPFQESGFTTAFDDDYLADCLGSGGAPDVVYAYVPLAGEDNLRVSLCGSSFDTGLSVYDAGFNQIACNDDWCYQQSRLDLTGVVPGSVLYVVIDGHGWEHGEYQLRIESFEPCDVSCPDGVPEGEPTLAFGYFDTWNGGCDTPPDLPFQDLWGDDQGSLVLCGVSGWYETANVYHRDTDWFEVHVGTAGTIEVQADAEHPTHVVEFAGECGNLTVVHASQVGPCAAVGFTSAGHVPGSLVRLWIAPVEFLDPPEGENEYAYTLRLSGLQPSTATAGMTWGAVKALYQ